MELLKKKPLKNQVLGNVLEDLFSRYHSRDYFSLDPIEFIYRYQSAADQEVMAILAGTLAYGKVEQIRKSVQKVIVSLESFSKSPGDWLQMGPPEKKLLSTFKHRFNTGEDLYHLFLSFGKYRQGGTTIGEVFSQNILSSDETIESALSQMITDVKKISAKNTSPSFRYLLTSPANGSACKRWLMILRWMVRQDKIDLGIWKNDRLSASQLVFPLDTHTFNLGKKLKLIKRNTADWKAALEMTLSLKKFDSQDPVRFDFAFCRSGMLDFRSALEKK